jgi:hypothetical protein
VPLREDTEMSQITQIDVDHFDGGKNLNPGSRDGAGAKVLAELARDMITQGNLSDSALTRGGAMQTVEFTDPPLADTDFFVVDRASSASADVINSGEAEWQSVSELDPPRNVTITTTSHADIDAVDVVVTGRVRDANGNLIAQTDTITLTDGGGATDAGTRAFSYIDSIAIPAQSGTGGELDFGFGDIIGLPSPIKTRAGLTAPIREVAAGAVATNGTFTTGAAQPPNGTYEPNSAPDGSNDYSLFYEADI